MAYGVTQFSMPLGDFQGQLPITSNFTADLSYLSVSSVMLQLTLLWSPYVIGQTIIFLPCDFYLSFFLSSYGRPM